MLETDGLMFFMTVYMTVQYVERFGTQIILSFCPPSSILNTVGLVGLRVVDEDK